MVKYTASNGKKKLTNLTRNDALQYSSVGGWKVRGFEKEKKQNNESPFKMEKPIYSYTDKMAVEDGFLRPFIVKKADGKFVEVPNDRITNNAYETLKEHYKKSYPEYNDGDFMSFFYHELMPIKPFARQKYDKGGIMKLSLNFRVGEYKNQKVLWYVPNENGGMTIMLPEDY